MVRFIALACPACGGMIDWQEEKVRIHCTYCGTLLQVEASGDQPPAASIVEELRTTRDLSASLLILHGLQDEIRQLWNRPRNWREEKVFRTLRRQERDQISLIEELRISAGVDAARTPGGSQIQLSLEDLGHRKDDGRGLLFAAGVYFFGGVLIIPFILIDRFLIDLFGFSGTFIPFTLLGSLLHLGVSALGFLYFRRKDHTVYSLILDASEWIMRIAG